MFTEMMEGTQARNFGLAVAKEYNLDVEVFPKQGKSEGPGSLVRVPFGIHRKSGERYKFYNLGTWRDQIAESMTTQVLV